MFGQAPHGLRLLADLRPGALLGEAGLLLWPMTVGAAPLAAVAWVVTYLLAVRAVAAAHVVNEARKPTVIRPPADGPSM